jgi:hypothetical protein
MRSEALHLAVIGPYNDDDRQELEAVVAEVL